FFDRGGDALPLAAAVEHFADVLADMAGPFGIGLQATGDKGVFQGFFDTEENRLGGEEAFLDADGFAARIALMLSGGGHETEQRAPIDRPAAGEVAGMRVEQADFVRADEDETGFIEPAAPGA